MEELAQVVLDQFSDAYPELREQKNRILKVISREEESFSRTLASGMNRLQALVGDLRQDGTQEIPGEEVFRLYDTYGFPYELTAELAREEGLSIDEDGFRSAMEKQRATSRSGAAFKADNMNRGAEYASITPRTEFVGYETTESHSTVVAIFTADGRVEQAEAGEAVEIVLDKTPFYGESGGQVGDSGDMRSETCRINIDDTFRAAPDLFVHRGGVEEGFVRVGDVINAKVDAQRRLQIRRNHTATHLLHKALRMTLGSDVHQAGSLVAPDRLRFDFTTMDPVTPDQVRSIMRIVNNEIAANVPVSTQVMDQKDAIESGAMALFGEKYGDRVRVVEIGDFSRELCGGTHVNRTGDIGPFVITSEGSVASGIRRIEALTGGMSMDRILGQMALLDDLGRELKVTWQEVGSSVKTLQDKVRDQDRAMERIRERMASSASNDLLAHVSTVDDVKVVAAITDVADRAAMRQLGDSARDRLQSGVIVLGAVVDGAPALLAMVTPDVVKRGVKAGDIIREIAPHIDGRGGGRPELAEAGGKKPEGLGEALGLVSDFVASKVHA